MDVLTNCWDRTAIGKSVARIARRTATDRRVIDYTAVCIRCASSRTGIDTFLIDASPIRRTVGAEDTFRPAVGDQADHVGQTAALGLSRDNLTLRTWSARCRRARIGWNRW